MSERSATSASLPPNRRAVLAAAGAGGLGLVVAGCGSGAGTDSGASGGAGGKDRGGEDRGRGEDRDGSTDRGGAEAPRPSGTRLVALDDIAVGEATAAQMPDGSPVVVTRTAQATVVAHSAKCTHKGCTVKPAGKELDCPCHGSKFDAATGAVRHGPADEPLPAIPVRVQGGDVVTGGA